MSCEVHITRKDLWWAEEGPVITVAEWLAYVASDPQLRLVPDDPNHTAMLRIRSPLPDPWLQWHEGEVRTAGPDDWVIAKMLLIASALNARVQGDEGHVYPRGLYEDYIAKISPS